MNESVLNHWFLFHRK